MATQFISGFYVSYLGRNPDSAGLQYYVNQVVAGRALEDIRIEIQNSPEAQIRSFYLAHLLREPDTGGMAYWIDSYNKGASLASIRDNIRRGTECKKDCLSSPDQTRQVATQFISGFYVSYLGRNPDSAGLQYYVNQVVAGRALEDIRIEIQNSPEAQIRSFYLAHLLREPDTGGMAYWIDSYNKGASLASIRDNIRRGTECKKDCL